MRPLNNISSIRTFLFCLATIFLGYSSLGLCQEWRPAKIILLPDSSFALVEIEKGKKIRHCPHHDANGKLDAEQLIYVMGNFDNEIWVDEANKQVAEKHLTRYYDRFMTKAMKEELRQPIDINRAALTELVTLPRVGPVLAVRIVKYREAVSAFATIEQIKRVEGIGSATFNAIKFYIAVK